MTSSPSNLNEDELEKLLQSQLPKVLPTPFPAFDYPRTRPLEVNRGRLSQWTLALSIVGLLGLGLMLTQPATIQRPDQPKQKSMWLANSTADGKDLLQRMNLEPKPQP